MQGTKVLVLFSVSMDRIRVLIGKTAIGKLGTKIKARTRQRMCFMEENRKCIETCPKNNLIRLLI